jgi:hypothetical protein
MDWHKLRQLRQYGFLTLAIVISAMVFISMVIPNLDLRGALILIAVCALFLGLI